MCNFDGMVYQQIVEIPMRSAFMYIMTRLISDVHFHITGQKLTFKTYNYRHCDPNTSMSLKCSLMFPKTVDYIPSGGVIATLLGCTLSVTVMENVCAVRSFESFQKKTWICSAIIVYSLAIPCFSSRRVSIDSRV